MCAVSFTSERTKYNALRAPARRHAGGDGLKVKGIGGDARELHELLRCSPEAVECDDD